MGRIAAVVITRDDARGIERALLSAKPYVDELVVFDLGSVDDTVARAQRCGARVESGTWRADTSGIRNDALARTDAAWRLVLEAGEWIDGGGAGLSALRETSTDHVGLVSMIPGEVGRGLAPVSLAARLLPAGVRFAGRRPEEPILDGLSQLRTGVVLASDEGEPARWRHDRSVAEALLLQGLSVRPGDPGMLAELGGILRAEGRLVEAYEAFTEALGRIDPTHPRHHEFVIEAIDAARAARRFPSAIALMDAHMGAWRESSDFAYVIGDLFFEMLLVEPAQAPQLAPLALTSWKRCLELGDRPQLAGHVQGRGSFLAAQNLYTLHLMLGQEGEAAHWWEVANRLRMDESTGRAARLLG